MLVTIHAEPRIEWQRLRLPAMVSGLDALGVQYRVTQSRTREDEGLAVLFGTTLWRRVEASGPYLLVDRASYGDPHFVSLVRDGHGRRGDHRVPRPVDSSRWEQNEVPIQPWHNGPRVVLCGQTETYSPHWARPEDWYATVRGATHFRPHPAGNNPTGLVETRTWKDCGLAVTLNSSIAVQAVLCGVPTVTQDEGAMAWDITSHNLDDIVKPPRLPWLHWLAWTQWRWDEIAEGKPWAHLL